MVVDYETAPRVDELEVDRVFQALADTTRRDILTRVIGQEQSVSELAAKYPMSFAAVQKHVSVLEHAKLVAKRRQGRQQIVHAELGSVRRAASLLRRYEDLWRERAHRIGDMLAEDDSQTKTVAN